jgi:hypothetical protein
MELPRMNNEETLQKTQTRIDNVRKALQRDGASLLDIDRAVLFKIISIMLIEHGLTREGVSLIVTEILEALEGVDPRIHDEEAGHA